MSRHRFLAWAALFAFAALPSARARGVPQSSAETLVMIDLTSDPVGADINIDNAEVGLTPMTVKLKPGKHAIRMFMTGYENWVQWVTIQAGAGVHIKATLARSAKDSAGRTAALIVADTQTPTVQRLINADVLDMLKAGLSQEIVIAKIHSSACEFDTTPAALEALKAANTPDAVILAMVEAPNGLPTRDRTAVTSEGHPSSEPIKNSAAAEKQTDEKKQDQAQKADDEFSDCKVRSQNEYDTKMNVIATMALSPMMRVYAANKLKQNLDAELQECRSQHELAIHSAAAAHP